MNLNESPNLRFLCDAAIWPSQATATGSNTTKKTPREKTGVLCISLGPTRSMGYCGGCS